MLTQLFFVCILSMAFSCIAIIASYMLYGHKKSSIKLMNIVILGCNVGILIFVFFHM